MMMKIFNWIVAYEGWRNYVFCFSMICGQVKLKYSLGLGFGVEFSTLIVTGLSGQLLFDPQVDIASLGVEKVREHSLRISRLLIFLSFSQLY